MRESGRGRRSRPAAPAARRGAAPRLGRLLDPLLALLAPLAPGAPPHPLERGLGPLRRLLRRASFARAARRGDHAFLEARHSAFWRSARSGDWYRRTEHRFESWFLAEHAAFAECLERAVGADPRLRHFYELGTGNGRALRHFAGRLPGILDFTGVDLNEARIELDRAEGTSARLRFACADALDFTRRQAESGAVFLTNAGVLEYLAPEALRELLEHAGRRLAPCAFALIEPLAPDMDPDGEGASRVFGAEGSFSHPYPRLLAAAGFRPLHRRETRVGGHRLLELIARSDG